MTKQGGECEENTGKQPDQDEQPEEKRSYYYDDAHGYEDFDPDTDEDAEDTVEPAKPRSDRPQR